MAHVALRDVQRMASHYARDLTEDIESWKADHVSAMNCRDLEGRLAVFNGLLQLLFNLKSRHDSQPIPEELDFDGQGETNERQMLQVFSQLLSACEALARAVNDFESQGYQVEGSREFGDYLDKIQRFLGEAKRIAKIEGSMGFRGVQMARDAAEAFRARLDAHSNPGTQPTSSSSSV
jgi:hypothetical protein